jgi:hypothetical protein
MGISNASKPLERLIAIGCVPAGSWKCDGRQLQIDLTACASAKNVLYAFVISGEVVYVGKSVRTLRERVSGYCKPHGSQRTNVRNNRAMIEAIAAGQDVTLYVLPDNGLLHYGGFHVNLAAGLEDSLIRDLKPAWNGQPSKAAAAGEFTR